LRERLRTLAAERRRFGYRRRYAASITGHTLAIDCRT
jgi:hypothetical protein